MAAKSVSSASLLSSSASNWLTSAWTAIQNDTSSTSGLMGMLASSNSSSSAILDNASTNLALITQSNTSKSTAFYAQIASQNQKLRQKQQLEKAFADLQTAQNQVGNKNVLDSTVYFNDGSYLDTNNNIMTMSDGTQYDTVTGLQYVDPKNTIQLANGAYVDTKKNIMHMADGTQIDMISGLKIPAKTTSSVTA